MRGLQPRCHAAAGRGLRRGAHGLSCCPSQGSPALGNPADACFPCGGGFSRGTRRTMLEGLGRGGAVRRDGHIVPVAAAWKVRQVDFGEGMIASRGEHPLGRRGHRLVQHRIPILRPMPHCRRRKSAALRLSRHLGWLLRSKLLRARLRRRIDAVRPDPSTTTRQKTESLVWGEVRDAAGQTLQSRLRCANGYSFTARSAVAAATACAGWRHQTRIPDAVACLRHRFRAGAGRAHYRPAVT